MPFRLLLLFGWMGLCHLADAQEFRTWGAMEYGLIRPEPFDPSKRYPLVISLHGNCPKEPGGQKPERQLFLCGFSDAVRQKHPCFMLIPQAPKAWWEGGKKASLISEIRAYTEILKSEFPIDPKRLYLVGFSDGGTAILHMLAWYPNTYAAAIPLSGWLGKNEPTQALVRSKTALWWFVGKDDAIAPWSYTERVVEQFQKAQGNMLLTIVEKNGDHVAPYRIFLDVIQGHPVDGTRQLVLGRRCDEKTPNPIEWLFKRSL